MGSFKITVLLVVIFVVVVVMACYGMFPATKRVPVLSGDLVNSSNRGALFVLIHGLDGGPRTWTHVQSALVGKGDIAPIYYDGSRTSNVDPVALASSISKRIQKLHDDHNYEKIVLIGYSAGALVARQAYLVGAQSATESGWTNRTDRIVLLAGMNRGWDVTGKKPMDMSVGERCLYWIGSWFGRLTKTGKFALSIETGSPFVSNLRLDWMNFVRANPTRMPPTIQLIGDIDDVVSDEDNRDLQTTSAQNFYWLKVRGTVHQNIIDFGDVSGKTATYEGIGPYRREKFLVALGGLGAIKAQNEEQGLARDIDVRQVVFVLHGIRDLGEWSADFEAALRAAAGQNASHLRVVSIRYGYFSMASFLFRPDRQKFVRWFMDQYTETLARYPNADSIDFIGHSNGTYLLGSALAQYSSMKIRRVVLAGSVLRKDYAWNTIVERGQVAAIRNYVATEDAVVALFPRFFEPKLTCWIGNDVGSAGFSGFEKLPASPAFQNVTITGGHSAFRSKVQEIAAFLVSSVPHATPSNTASHRSILELTLRLHAGYFFWLIWILLAALILVPGIRVAIAAGQFAWIPLSLYIGLVFVLLKRL